MLKKSTKILSSPKQIQNVVMKSSISECTTISLRQLCDLDDNQHVTISGQNPTRFIPPGFDSNAIRVNPAVTKEMERLRNTPTPTMDLSAIHAPDDASLKIQLLNVRSYLEHVEDMKSDPMVVPTVRLLSALWKHFKEDSSFKRVSTYYPKLCASEQTALLHREWEGE